MERFVVYTRMTLIITVLALFPLSNLFSQTCQPPTNVQMGTITHNTAQVQFIPAPGAQFTYIHFREVGMSAWITASASSLSYTMYNLAASTQYEVELRSMCGNNLYSAWTPLMTFTTLGSNGQCPPPAGITVLGTSNNTATLSWTPVPGASYYFIHYKPANATVWNTMTTSAGVFTLGNLQPSTTYDVKIRSYCANIGQGSFSPIVSFMTGNVASPCNPPLGIVASNITANAATISWSPVIGALNYSIKYREAGANTWSTGGTIQLQYIFSGLADSTQYEVQLRSNCGSNLNGSWSPIYTFSTLSSGNTCPAPTGITVTGTTANSASISWNPVPGAMFYNVYYKPSVSSSWTYQVISNPAITIFNLTASTQYDYKIRTNCPVYGLGGYSATDTFTTTNIVNPCLPPTNISVGNITSTGAVLTWVAVPGAMHYQIRYRIVGTNNWMPGSSSLNTYTFNNLTDTTTYEFQVRSFCGANNYGGWSPIQNFTTLSGGTGCPAPVNPLVTAITNHSATITWAAVPGVNNYYLQYKTIAANNWNISSTNQPHKTLYNLNDSTVYQFRLKSYCPGIGYGAFSPVFTFTTSGVPSTCLPPANITVGNISASSAQITWSPVVGAMYSQIHYRSAGSLSWLSATTSNTAYQFHNLADTTIYELQIRSYCGSNVFGGWSPVVTFTTLSTASITCLPPTGVAATNITMHSAKISWSPVPGVNYYRVQYRRVGTINWLFQYTAIPERILHNLVDSSTYQVRLSSYCGNNAFSIWSPGVFFVTPDDPNTITPRLQNTVNQEAKGQISKISAGIDDQGNVRDFEVYPNPASGAFRIRTESTEYRKVLIYNIQGKLIKSYDFLPMTEYFVDPLGPGVYLIRLSNGDQLSAAERLLVR